MHLAAERLRCRDGLKKCFFSRALFLKRTFAPFPFPCIKLYYLLFQEMHPTSRTFRYPEHCKAPVQTCVANLYDFFHLSGDNVMFNRSRYPFFTFTVEFSAEFFREIGRHRIAPPFSLLKSRTANFSKANALERDLLAISIPSLHTLAATVHKKRARRCTQAVADSHPAKISPV